MNEIICPNCKKAFKVDEAGFADILKQVRDHQFEEELNSRLALAEKDKESAVELAKANIKNSLQEELAKKDKELTELKAKSDSQLAEQLAKKETEIAEVKSQLQNVQIQKQLDVAEAIKLIEKERDNLASDLKIKETEMFGTKMGFFPTDGKNVSGAIVQGEDYKPSKDGIIAYLNGGNDLQNVLDKVEKNNGKVIVPKTQISPEMGYFGMFIDSEGNKMAVHSIN